MSSVAWEKIIEWAILLLVAFAVIYGGYRIMQPLIDSFTGANELSEQAKLQGQDGFDLFLKKYTDCKNSPDENCLCPLSVPLPKNVVVKLSNNGELQQTELSVVKGSIKENNGVFDFALPEYSGKNEVLSDKPREVRVVKDDVPYLAADDWSVFSFSDKQKERYVVLNPKGLEYVSEVYFSLGSYCSPCLFVGTKIEGSSSRAFDPGYLYKLDAKHVVLLSERQRKAVVDVSGVKDLERLRSCSFIGKEGVGVFQKVVTSVEKCYPSKSLAADYLSKEMSVTVGEESGTHVFYKIVYVVGLRYKLDKFGKGEWVLGEYYTWHKNIFGGKENFFYQAEKTAHHITDPGDEQKKMTAVFLNNLKGKNVKEGLEFLKGKIDRGEYSTDLVELPQAKEISYLMRLESTKVQPVKIAEPVFCSSVDLFKGQKSIVPKENKIVITSKGLSLYENGRGVRSEELPFNFCVKESDGVNARALSLSSLDVDQNIVRLNWYREPDESICVYPVTMKVSEQQTIEGVASVLAASGDQNL